MARRDGIFRRFTRWLGFGTPEPPRRPEPPSEPIMQPSEQRQPQTVPSRAPRYRDGTWVGVSDQDWRTIRDLADHNIELGTTYNRELDRNQLEGLLQQIGFGRSPDVQRYRAIIDALESGDIDVDEMIDLLHQADQAADDYATGQDSSRGAALMQSIRDRGLPDELGFYHWEYY